MKKIVVLLAMVFGLTACSTMSGTYRVTGVAKDGSKIPFVFDVRGSQLYSARNAICGAHPGATVSIVDLDTRKDLPGVSPYQCR